MSFTPHTPEDIALMLNSIGIDSVEQLFDEIPSAIRIEGLPDLADGINEMAMGREIKKISAGNKNLLNFIGAGAYQHHIPSAVWQLAGRGELLTAYTPYQAEASQGSLQIIFEFQTMIASLCGMDVANASMYDGASALAESILMAVRANKKTTSKKIVIADSIHPCYLNVMNSITRYQGIEIQCVETDRYNDVNTLKSAAHESFAAVVLPQPNFLGQLTRVDAITDWAHQHHALVIGLVNPVTLGLLKEPGSWGARGADIVCGEGQPLGVPLAGGGPYFGFMACKKQFIRQMPGRIVGKTTDTNGKTGYCLTLQAREQHIRRSKATSNICTNQGLLMTVATIYMSLLGPQGLKNVAIKSHQNTARLIELLNTVKQVHCVYADNFCHEMVIQVPSSAKSVLKKMADRGVAGGYDLATLGQAWADKLLVCSTEVHNENDLQQFITVLKTAIEDV
ncbi:MAG: aminomethyl-transferring glycine dehydrogenase subunit GcvPA [Pseudomonadota bacterium]